MTRSLGLTIAIGAILMGCGSQPHTQTTTCEQANATHEELVREILSELWAADNDLERAAIERSLKIKDERIAESLIAKLRDRGCLVHPRNWYTQEVVEALAYQGYSVEVRQRGFVVRPPIGSPLLIERRVAELSVEDLGPIWNDDDCEAMD